MSELIDELLGDASERMSRTVDATNQEFASVRTGRASPALLEPIRVEAYGNEVPLPQVGTIAVPEARMITVQVWDRTLVNNVVKAIRDSGLGLNPGNDGQLVRVPIPMLTGERRTELSKAAHKYAEGAKVAVRGVRRDGMEQIKALEKKATISKDDEKRWSDEVQKLTDQYVKKIDDALAEKDKEIKQV